MKKIFFFLMLMMIFSPACAWWDNDWSNKRQINITETSGTSLVEYPFVLSNINIGSASADSIRLVNETSGNILKFGVSRINSSYVNISSLFNLTASQTQTDIYLYYGNPLATATNISYSTADDFLDGFEDGSYSYPDWYNDGDALATVEVSDSYAKEGSKSLRLYADGDGTNNARVEKLLNRELQNGENVSVWVRVSSNSGWVFIRLEDVGSGWAGIQFDHGNMEYNDENQAPSTIIGAPATNTWYKLVITQQASTLDTWIFDSSGSLLDYTTGWNWGHRADKINIENNDQGIEVDAYFDEVTFAKKITPSPSYSVGSEILLSNFSITIITPTTSTKQTEHINATALISWSDVFSGHSTNYTVFAYFNDTYLANITGTLASGENYTWNIGGLDIYDGSFKFKVNGTETNKGTTASDTSTFDVELYFLNITSPSTPKNYYEQIPLILNVSCWRDSDKNISIYLNETGWNTSQETIFSCGQEYVTLNLSHTATSEGLKDINVTLSVYDAREKNHTDSTQFYSDLYNPTLNFSYSLTEGFRTNITETLNFTTNDTGSPYWFCNLTISSVNHTNLNMSWGNTTFLTDFDLVDGTNNPTVTCTDLAGHTVAKSDYTFDTYVKYIILINEDTGDNFTLSDANVTVFGLNSALSYDFNEEGQIWVYWVSEDTESLRFEQTYEGYSDTVVRNFDAGLMYETMPVCVNPIDTFYEQTLYSTKTTPVYLVSQYTGCYVVGDYTQYSYSGALMTYGHTTDKIYYLYVVKDGNLIYLSSVDGSSSSQINLDLLEYNLDGFSINFDEEFVDVNSLSNQTVKIYYKNKGNDNTALKFEIYDGDDLIFSTTTFSDYNEAVVYFDSSTLTLNNDILKLVVTSTDSDGTNTLTKFFNMEGKTGVIPAEIGFIISAGLLAFSLTIIASFSVIGWFGLLASIFSLGLLSFSVATWYVLVLQFTIIGIMVLIAILSANGKKRIIT